MAAFHKRTNSRENSVFARLFSSSSSATPPPTSHEPRKFLKVKIVTWNMGETLPKGDLSELFDWIPSCAPSSTPPNNVPVFPSEPLHPYHLVVVGGQECPSTSYIPKALGAGFKFKDKDPTKDKDNKIRIKVEQETQDPSLSGWTGLLQHWLCLGEGCEPSNTLELPDTKSKHSRNSASFKPSGAYQLLVKERMLGVYLAVFVHVDTKPFVQGISKSSVTAGLIGGRLGNKGGVGISLKIDGTTLLFLNCHLAAHEGMVHHRLANLTKIKAELAVNDFLSPGDPRMVSEDITDKFDFTFLFGDLNFRLDISRLHADWLIAHQEYQKALAFDQLLNLMRNGQHFTGFSEAPIDFPPTFKYDVLKTLKRTKNKKAGKEITADEALENDGQNGVDGASVASSFQSGKNFPPEDGESDNNRVSLTPVVATAEAAHKAKKKLVGLIKSSSRKGHRSTLSGGDQSTGLSLNEPTPLELGKRASTTDLLEQRLRPPVMSAKSLSRKSSQGSDTDDDDLKFDSSTKQRVPSWCDRILTKSTLYPQDVDEDEVLPSSRGRSRVGSFFSAAFRLNSTTKAKPLVSEPAQYPASMDPTSGTSPSLSAFEASRSVDAIASPLKNGPVQPLHLQAHPLRRSLSASSSSIPSSAIDRSARRASTTTSLTSQRRPSSPSNHSHSASGKWRFLPSFFSPASNVVDTRSPDNLAPVPPPPRRGDVVPLAYTTLSDRSMRNLEARSDHRPLKGAYAVYI